MASPGGYTEREDLNYIGELYLIGANQTPLLSMMGGLAGGDAKTVRGFYFAVAQPWNLGSAAQTVVSEDTAANTGATPTTITRGQDTNYIQIMHRAYAASYAKKSTYGEVGAISTVSGDTAAGNPVTDEVAFQRTGQLRQLAIDIEYSFFQGSAVAPATSATAGKTQGLQNAISTNTVAAGTTALTKSLINQLLRTMAGNGAQWIDIVIFCNAFQKQQLTDIYGYAPEDRNVGGVNIKQIETDFCMAGVVYAPQMPTDEIYIVDMSVMYPVYCPVDGMLMIDEPIAKTKAAETHQLYLQIGLDFGPEEYHGSITGLTTS
jgi:hypothetical protein